MARKKNKLEGLEKGDVIHITFLPMAEIAEKLGFDENGSVDTWSSLDECHWKMLSTGGEVIIKGRSTPDADDDEDYEDDDEEEEGEGIHFTDPNCDEEMYVYEDIVDSVRILRKAIASDFKLEIADDYSIIGECLADFRLGLFPADYTDADDVDDCDFTFRFTRNQTIELVAKLSDWLEGGEEPSASPSSKKKRAA